MMPKQLFLVQQQLHMLFLHLWLSNLLVTPGLCRENEAHNRAVVLEMIGDLPEAESKPPSNMLFICKLNQVTTEEVGPRTAVLHNANANSQEGQHG